MFFWHASDGPGPSARSHDLHHYYSNYGTNSKNYGENFWLWDWAFGTLTKKGVVRLREMAHE